MHSFKPWKSGFGVRVLIAGACALIAGSALAQPAPPANTVRGVTVTPPAAPAPPASSVPRYTSAQLAQTVLQARLRYYESLGLEIRSNHLMADINIYGPDGKAAAVRRLGNIVTAVQGRSTRLYRQLDAVAGRAYTATVQSERVFQESLAGKRTAAELQAAERVRELAVQELINTQRETLLDIRNANMAIEMAMLEVDMEALSRDYYLTEGLNGPFGGVPFVPGGRGATFCRNCR